MLRPAFGALAIAVALVAPVLAADGSAPVPPPTLDVKPYDPQLMRLAEILGALSTLREVCADPDAGVWRQHMQALLDAEGTTPGRKDRLAGSFNHGVEGYGFSYRTCTANARAAIARFLAEADTIGKQVENRYGAT